MNARLHLMLTTAALLALACGAFRPFAPAGRCDVQGLAGIELEDMRDCECLRRQVERAQELVKPITGDAGFSDVTLWVHASDAPFELDTWADGQFVPPGDIEESRWGGAVAHELLHAYEIDRLGESREVSALHEGWDARGWTKLGDDFWWSTQPGGDYSCW